MRHILETLEATERMTEADFALLLKVASIAGKAGTVFGIVLGIGSGLIIGSFL